MARRMMKGFQNILVAKVREIKGRGGRTKKGKKIQNPAAYVAAGLRRTGIKKYGTARFKGGRKKRR